MNFKVVVCDECKGKQAPACKTAGCWYETTKCAQCELVVFVKDVNKEGLCFHCWAHKITG